MNKRPTITPRDPGASIKQHGINGTTNAIQEVPGMGKIMKIPIERIRPGEFQKRVREDPEKFEQLKKQIADLGYLHVGKFYADPTDERYFNPGFGGHLRIKAAKELNMTHVYGFLAPYDREALALGTFFENSGRQALTIVEEGLTLLAMKEMDGWDNERIMKKLNISEPHLKACLLAAKLPPDVQDFYHEIDRGRGKRLVTCFRKLIREIGLKESEGARQRLMNAIKDDSLTIKQVEAEVEAMILAHTGIVVVEPENAPTPVVAMQITQKPAPYWKGFYSFERAIGNRAPTSVEREDLMILQEKIESILSRRES